MPPETIRDAVNLLYASVHNKEAALTCNILTCVSTPIPTCIPQAACKHRNPILGPTPGRISSSSMVFGTSPSNYNRSSMSWERDLCVIKAKTYSIPQDFGTFAYVFCLTPPETDFIDASLQGILSATCGSTQLQ